MELRSIRVKLTLHDGSKRTNTAKFKRIKWMYYENNIAAWFSACITKHSIEERTILGNINIFILLTDLFEAWILVFTFRQTFHCHLQGPLRKYPETFCLLTWNLIVGETGFISSSLAFSHHWPSLSDWDQKQHLCMYFCIFLFALSQFQFCLLPI